MASEMLDEFDFNVDSPPKARVGVKKTWKELQQTVRETRKMMSRITPPVPSNFEFRSVTDQMSATVQTRLYFLGVQDVNRDSTLLYTDLPDQPSGPPTSHDGGDAHSLHTSVPNPLDRMDDDAPSTTVLPQLWINTLFTRQPSESSTPMSREEQLLRERKRLCSFGLTSYEMSKDGMFVIPANNGIYVCQDLCDGTPPAPREIPTLTYGARLDPKLCPSNSDLLIFVHESDLWLVCLASGRELRLTYTRNGYQNIEDDYLSAGVPSFVMQEEFDRYTGYWWSPRARKRGENQTVYHILYEEVEESDVGIVSLVSPLESEGNTEQYRYPKAGTTNATSNLRLLEITVVTSGKDPTAVIDVQVNDKSLQPNMAKLCPSPMGEYIVRAGWTHVGQYMYAVLLNRQQDTLSVLLISPESFSSEESDHPEYPHVQCIYQETSNIWINVHNCIHFLPETCEDEISFIFASEKSGFRHLYRITSKLHPPGYHGKGLFQGCKATTQDMLASQSIGEVAITSGDWAVMPDEIMVDESRHLVYFMGLKDSPLETHLYVTSYNEGPTSITRLTCPGFTHSVTLSPDSSKFVSVFSSLANPPQSQVFTLLYSGQGEVSCVAVGRLTQKTETPGYTPPCLFSYPSRTGHQTYGLYFLPRGYEQGRRYPTILFVYGGPQVQMVANAFKGQKLLRLHTLSEEGYAVVVIDGRGSAHRGMAFESVLKDHMGTVEINDQVEGLLWLASQADFIDMSRVAIHGWSYGGYLSLLGLAQRPDVFKLAIAGAPVVNWELYDTGYTERYLGLPQTNKAAYQAGNVLSYLNKLSRGDTKLLLIHGLIDENVHFNHTSTLIQHLIQLCIPYQLQIYPNERHGIRNHDASEHYKTNMLKFLQDNL